MPSHRMGPIRLPEFYFSCSHIADPSREKLYLPSSLAIKGVAQQKFYMPPSFIHPIFSGLGGLGVYRIWPTTQCEEVQPHDPCTARTKIHESRKCNPALFLSCCYVAPPTTSTTSRGEVLRGGGLVVPF